MRPPTAGLADRTAEHQHVDRAAIAHIHMIPMVDRRPDDDHRAAIGLFRIGGKFAGDRNDRLALHPGDAFRPGRGKRRIVIVRPRHVAAAKTTIEAVIGQHQVIHRRHRHAATAGQRDATHRQVAGQNLTMVGGDKMLRRPAAEIREIHGRNLGTFPSQAQPQRYLIALPVFRLQVPFALLAPAIAERTKRGHQRAGPLIKGDRLPLRIIGLPQRARQFGTAQQPFRHQPAIPFHQPHQERHIGVTPGVVGEERHAAVEVEFAQNHMAHRQRQRRIGALFRRQPDIGEFGRLGIIRADNRGFGAFIPHLRIKMRIRRAGLRHVGPPDDDVAGIVPISTLRHVGLFAPGLRARRRQVAIPVVERQADPTEQRQIPRARGVRHHRHCRDR